MVVKDLALEMWLHFWGTVPSFGECRLWLENYASIALWGDIYDMAQRTERTMEGGDEDSYTAFKKEIEDYSGDIDF